MGMDLGRNDYLLIGGVIAVVLFGLWAGPPEQHVLAVADDGVTAVEVDAMERVLDDIDGAALSTVEEEGLVAVHVAERGDARRLAALADGGPAVLADVAGAEETHAAAAALILDRYGLEPGGLPAAPAANLTGVDALRAAAVVQERSVAAFDARLRETDNDDLRFVYARLQRASRNHLRLLDAEMDRRNATHAPQHLNASAYRAIVDAPVER